MAEALICDNYMDMNVADANGTAVTVSILDAGTQGTPQGTWSITENSVGVSSSTSLTVESSGGSGTDRASQLYLRDTGTNYGASSTHRRFKYDGAKNFTYVSLTTNGGNFYACTLAGWVTIGMTDAGASGSLFDLLSLVNNSGNFAIMQLQNGNAPNGGGYAINLHTNPGGVTTYTGHFTCAQNDRYWCSLNFDSVNATARLDIYDTSYVLKTTIMTTTGNGGTNITGIRMGNAETGTSSGTSTYFENMLIDWTKAASPLGPVGQANYWITKTAQANADSTGATSMGCTLAGVSVGDLIVVFAKWEGGAGVSSSCSDGTSTLTAVTEVDHASGDPRTQVFYLLSSVASGSVTYTVSYGASRTWRDIVVYAVTPPAGSPALALDGTIVNDNGTSTALKSKSIVTSKMNGVAFGTYGAFGATIAPVAIGGIRADEYRTATGTGSGGTATASAMWMRQYDLPFIGPATGTLNASNRWVSTIIAFAQGAAGWSVFPYKS